MCVSHGGFYDGQQLEGRDIGRECHALPSFRAFSDSSDTLHSGGRDEGQRDSRALRCLVACKGVSCTNRPEARGFRPAVEVTHNGEETNETSMDGGRFTST